MKQIKLMWLIPVFFFSMVSAQKGSLSVKVDKDTMYIDEVVKVEFHLDNITGNFRAPDFSGFQVVSGPNTSSSFSMINGVVSQKKSYSYILVPQRDGMLTLGSAVVENDGEQIATDPIDIFVWPEKNQSKGRKTRERMYNFEQNPDSTGTAKQSKPASKRVLKKI